LISKFLPVDHAGPVSAASSASDSKFREDRERGMRPVMVTAGDQSGRPFAPSLNRTANSGRARTGCHDRGLALFSVRGQGLLPGWGRPMGRGTDPGSTQYLISYASRPASAAWLS
jgi:hypothetical protein